MLWAGTDDGDLWVTRDGGKNWTNVTEKVGLPGPRWVATIEASRFAEGRCYVCLRRPPLRRRRAVRLRHRGLRPDVEVAARQPADAARRACLREDIENPNLLYLRHRVRASGRRSTAARRGRRSTTTCRRWRSTSSPVHPTAGEIVAATHGRSLWVLDVTPLRQMKPETAKAEAPLFEPNTAMRWRSEPERGSMYGNGSRHFFGENPPPGRRSTTPWARRRRREPEGRGLRRTDRGLHSRRRTRLRQVRVGPDRGGRATCLVRAVSADGPRRACTGWC